MQTVKTDFDINVDLGASNGTSLQGYVETTRAHLVHVFGDPAMDDPHSWDKVTTEWVIRFFDTDETIATIYDWKRYEEGPPAIHESYVWHIGGNSKRAVELVCAQLEIPGQTHAERMDAFWKAVGAGSTNWKEKGTK